MEYAPKSLSLKSSPKKKSIMNLIALEFDKENYPSKKSCFNQIAQCNLDYDTDGDLMENENVFAYQVGDVYK